MACRNKDANTAWTSASDGVLEERLYYCQNWRADVSAIVTASGTMKEWATYSAYGIPIGVPGGDTDSTGACDPTDITNFDSKLSQYPQVYDVRYDIDLNGTNDATDKSTVQNNFSGITLGRGSLSASGVVNLRGYDGYEHMLASGARYCSRRRVLDSELGRWLERDPLVYQDGTNMYVLCAVNPERCQDPFGTEMACGSSYVNCIFICLLNSSSLFQDHYSQLYNSEYEHYFNSEDTPDDDTNGWTACTGWPRCDGGSESSIDINSDNPSRSVAHELEHALQSEQAKGRWVWSDWGDEDAAKQFARDVMQQSTGHTWGDPCKDRCHRPRRKTRSRWTWWWWWS